MFEYFLSFTLKKFFFTISNNKIHISFHILKQNCIPNISIYKNQISDKLITST
jgi:hypothetical protein